MKKKIIILAAIAVSGLAAVVASNTNDIFINSDADAMCEIKHGSTVVLACEGNGQCTVSKMGYTLTCDGTQVNK